MNARRPSDVLRLISYLWEFKLTASGKLYVAGGVICGMVASSSIYIPVYHLFVALFSVGFMAFLVGLIYRPKLNLVASAPEQIVAGEVLRASVRVENRSVLPALDIASDLFRLPQGLSTSGVQHRIDRLAKNEAVDLTVEITPRRRGVYVLPGFRAFSTFPLGVCRSGSTKSAPSRLVVLPRFHSVDALDLPVQPRYQPGGIALTSRVGESPEYIGNRDYRIGDPLRRIDFRGWARLAKPVVREYQEEYYCRVALVLDTYVRKRRRIRREGFPDLEAAVSLAATVADALAREEYIIDIFAAGPDLHVFRTGRHTTNFDAVLELLAGVDACRANPFETVSPALAEELTCVSTAIFILLDWDEDRARLVREAAEAGCAIKLFVIHDGPTSLPVDASVESATCLAPAEVLQGGWDVL